VPKKVTVEQAEIEVAGSRFTVTCIPAAISGCWFTIHDACEIWGAVAIDLNGEVAGWRCPPKKEFRKPIEEAIKKEFGLPELEGGEGNDKTTTSPDS
jgi:hypothetical protein